MRHFVRHGTEGIADIGSLELTHHLLRNDVTAWKRYRREPRTYVGVIAHHYGLDSSVVLWNNHHHVCICPVARKRMGGCVGNLSAVLQEMSILLVQRAEVAVLVHENDFLHVLPDGSHVVVSVGVNTCCT